MFVSAVVNDKQAHRPDETSIFVSIVTRGEGNITEESAIDDVNKMVPRIGRERIGVSVHVIPTIRQQISLIGVSDYSGEVVAKPLVPFLGFWNIPESEFNSLSISITVAVSFALLVGVVTGYMLSLMKKRSVNGDDTDSSEMVTFRDDTVTRAGKE
jgi:hypothetical protein